MALKRRPHKSKPKPQAEVRREAIAQPSPRQITRVRKWLFHLVVALGMPLVALGLIETGLRLGGYGYSTDFFRRMRISGQEFLVENDRFGFRFFPREIARMPAALRIPATKSPGTFRIFILGESAAMGDPEPAFGVGRYMEALLCERFPRAKFEVVNAAMTAINSHAILPIARDCARHEGDLWIIYMGNNEMIGPFGMATPSGVQSPPSVSLVRLSLAVQKSRIGQLISEVGQQLRASDSKPWMGMQMFAGNLIEPDDERRQQVYRNFDRNLQDILRVGLDSGAHVLLSTMVVNLKDCPPFGTTIRSNLPNGERAQVEQWLEEGARLAEQSDIRGALGLYERAARLDPRSAELEFRMGDCWLRLTNQLAAGEHFQRACDFDGLTFRANAQINGMITATSRKAASAKLILVDAEAALRTNFTNQILGKEIFFEHVHLNFDGNYRLARVWADQIVSLLPGDITQGDPGNWASQEVCERRLGLTDWDRRNVLKEVQSRLKHPPLSTQINNNERLEALNHWQADLLRRMGEPKAVAKAREIYLEALRSSPQDHIIRQNFGNFLWDSGEIAQAVEQWQRVRELIPQDHSAYYELGRLAFLQGRFTDAKSLLEHVLVMRPSFAPGWFELGKVRAAQGNYESAIQAYDRALVFQPNDSKIWFHSGVAHALLGRQPEAISHYRQAVHFDPSDWRAHFELGSLLGRAGKMSEAKAASEEAVRLNPSFLAARLNLGMALVQLGQLRDAEVQFEEVLRLDPTNSKAADYLSQTRKLKHGKP